MSQQSFVGLTGKAIIQDGKIYGYSVGRSDTGCSVYDQDGKAVAFFPGKGSWRKAAELASCMTEAFCRGVRIGMEYHRPLMPKEVSPYSQEARDMIAACMAVDMSAEKKGA